MNWLIREFAFKLVLGLILNYHVIEKTEKSLSHLRINLFFIFLNKYFYLLFVLYIYIYTTRTAGN